MGKIRMLKRLMAFMLVAAVVFSFCAALAPVEDDAPDVSAPAETSAETAPEEPSETAPEEPGETAPEEPGETAPEEPGETNPEEPGETAPEEPGETDPEEPGEANPEDPDETDPEEPGETEGDGEEAEIGEDDIPNTAAPHLYQTLTAKIYTDGTYLAECYDPAVITVSGLLPGGAYVAAYPVEIVLEDFRIVAAYDIKIFAAEGMEIQPDETVLVTIILPDLASVDEVDIFHIADHEAGEPELIAEAVATGGAEVQFEAASFSIYVVATNQATTEVDITSGGNLKIHQGASIRLYSNSGTSNQANNHTWSPSSGAVGSITSSSGRRAVFSANSPGTVTVTHRYRSSSSSNWSSETVTITVLPPVTTVATVDNDAHGITMRMIDFNANFPNDFTGGGFDSATGNIMQGLLSRATASNGYPTITSNPSINMAGWFGDGATRSGASARAANHLFLQSVYDATGYFEYDSSQNFAAFNTGSGNFSVYNALGTPSNENIFFTSAATSCPTIH